MGRDIFLLSAQMKRKGLSKPNKNRTNPQPAIQADGLQVGWLFRGAPEA